MSDGPSWSIDDFLEWACSPDEDFWPVLSQLRDYLLRNELQLTGWRCSWDRRGKDCQSDKIRQFIPALSIEDLKFELLPDSSDFVLIPFASKWCLGHRHGAVVSDLGSVGITWVDREYEEQRGPSIEPLPPSRIYGWGELRLQAKKVQSLWLHSKTQLLPSKRKPGPTPHLSNSIIDRMLDDLRSERETPETLKSLKLEALSAQYGGSKNTANRARE